MSSTGDGPGLERFRSLGVVVRRFGEVEAPAVATRVETKKTVREQRVTRSLLLDVDDPIGRLPVSVDQRDELFRRARIKTVGDLIGADPSAVAEEMDRGAVTAELVALWQAHAALVCFTPGLDLPEAKRWVDCDILSVEELAEADADRLSVALRKRGASESLASRTEAWIESAGDQLTRWRSSGYADSWRPQPTRSGAIGSGRTRAVVRRARATVIERPGVVA